LQKSQIKSDVPAEGKPVKETDGNT
jgi:hypothetical protein